MPNPQGDFLRHTLATLAYRAAKPLRDAPEGFSEYRVAAGTRTAGEILSHLGDLLEWALSMALGREEWRESPASSWDDGVARFFSALQVLDAYLASDEPVHAEMERLFQGPVADALTHIGQIDMLRRAAGAPILGENYFKAGIQKGQVGAKQPLPVREFE